MADKLPSPGPAPEGGEAVTLIRPAARPRVTNTLSASRVSGAKKASPKTAAKTLLPKTLPSKPLSTPKAKPSRAQLVGRVTAAIERELSHIETIIGGERVTPARRTEAERRVRTLASLARTLAELSRLRAAQREAKVRNDDAVPRNLDEFRATLERRLEQVVAARQDRSARENEPD